MKKRYAYLTEAGILHINSSLEGAKENAANGKIIETYIEAEHGYPVFNGEQIIVYSPTVMKLDAQSDKTIDPIPELAELYKQCM